MEESQGSSRLPAVIFFILLGLVPVPVELGKLMAFFLKLGKIINHNSEEKNGIENYFQSSILSNSNNCFHFPFHESFFLIP